MNLLPTVAAIAAVSGATAVVGGFWYYATPKFFRVGYMPKQPGVEGFSHQIHAGKLGMDCRYCHSKIESASEANIPSVESCYGCHADGKLAKLAESATHRERTEFVREAFLGNQTIPWTRVHKLPDYVRNFPHAAHLRAGVSCVSCHGEINAMPVVFHAEPMSMGWCLECHRNPAAKVVPPERVTQLQWAKQHLAERAAQGDAGLLEGQQLVDAAKIIAPENCGACHY
jgi:hypothetical protein